MQKDGRFAVDASSESGLCFVSSKPEQVLLKPGYFKRQFHMLRLVGFIVALMVSFASYSAEIGCGISVFPEAQVKRGCGCGYYLRTDGKLQTVFQAGLDSSDNPRMFIDGELVQLVPAPSNGEPAYSKVGDEFSEAYRYDQLKIRFNNVVSSSCAGSEGCEVISFETTMEANGSSCSIEPLKLRGDCGC